MSTDTPYPNLPPAIAALLASPEYQAMMQGMQAQLLAGLAGMQALLIPGIQPPTPPAKPDDPLAEAELLLGVELAATLPAGPDPVPAPLAGAAPIEPATTWPLWAERLGDGGEGGTF